MAISTVIIKNRLYLCFIINRKQAAGLFCATVGILVIISRGDIETLLRVEFNIGDLTVVFAMFAGALYNVLLRKVPTEIDVPLLLLIIQIFGVITTSPIYLAETLLFRPVLFTSETVIALIWIGVAVTADSGRTPQCRYPKAWS